ncbi:MAG: polysaccharide deacetylase family protein, partial [Pyrinomonadaceae bacterium]
TTMLILTYHSLDTSGSVISLAPEVFAGQMACLADGGWRGVSLGEAVEHRDAEGSWPERTVALTFDDGYENFYESAWPVLRRHGFSATVFLVSGHVGGSNDWDAPPAGLGERRILSWSQAAELARAGIEIGAHTRTHPDLRRLPAEQIKEEVAGSRVEIEDRLGRAVESFAYPFGGTSRAAVEAVGGEFRAACTTELKRANGEPPHQLPRIDMYYVRSSKGFARLLDGRLDNYLAVRRLVRRVRGALFAGA